MYAIQVSESDWFGPRWVRTNRYDGLTEALAAYERAARDDGYIFGTCPPVRRKTRRNRALREAMAGGASFAARRAEG